LYSGINQDVALCPGSNIKTYTFSVQKQLNVILIIVSKMMSHCAGTVQMREVRKRDKKVRRDVISDDSRQLRERVQQ